MAAHSSTPATRCACIAAPLFRMDNSSPQKAERQRSTATPRNRFSSYPAQTAAGRRSSVALRGLWEVCRHDEQMPGEVAAPIKDFPEQPYWRASRSQRQEHVAAGPRVRSSLVVSNESKCPERLQRQVVLPGFSAKQSQYHSRRERHLLRLRQKPLCPRADRYHQGGQAGPQRDPRRHPRRLVCPHFQPKKSIGTP